MISILKSAQHELDEAFDFYEAQLFGLGYEFIDEFEKAVKRIEQFPEAWQSFSLNTRRCQFNRFPYAIIYDIYEENIVIIAVAHLHRRPFYWKHRRKTK